MRQPTHTHLWACRSPHSAGQWGADMETSKAPHIFIELTLSEKLLAVLDGVCSTQVSALSKTHPVIYSKHRDTEESCSKDVWLLLAMYSKPLNVC